MKLVIILLTVLLAIFFANGFTSAGNPSNDGIRAYPYARYVTSKPPVKSTIKPTLRPTINPTVKAKGFESSYQNTRKRGDGSADGPGFKVDK